MRQRERWPFTLTRSRCDAIRCAAICNVVLCELSICTLRTRKIVLLANRSDYTFGCSCCRCFCCCYYLQSVYVSVWMCIVHIQIHSVFDFRKIQFFNPSPFHSTSSKCSRVMNGIMQTFNRICGYGWECVYILTNIRFVYICLY